MTLSTKASDCELLFQNEIGIIFQVKSRAEDISRPTTTAC